MTEPVIIYRATAPDGLQYIGKTRGTLARRIAGHYREAVTSDTHLHRAIQRFGKDMRFESLGFVCGDHAGAHLERAYIRLFDTLHPNGMNSTVQSCGGKPAIRNATKHLTLPALRRSIIADRHKQAAMRERRQ